MMWRHISEIIWNLKQDLVVTAAVEFLHFPPCSIILDKFYHMMDTPFAQQWHIIRFIRSGTVVWCNTDLWRSKNMNSLHRPVIFREIGDIISTPWGFTSCPMYVYREYAIKQCVCLLRTTWGRGWYVASRMVYESLIDTRGILFAKILRFSDCW